MSIKIYNGYRLKTIKTLEEALKFFIGFREVIQKETKKIVSRRCAHTAATIYDRITHLGLDPKGSDLEDLNRYLKSKYEQNILIPIIYEFEEKVYKASAGSSRSHDDIDC